MICVEPLLHHAYSSHHKMVGFYHYPCFLNSYKYSGISTTVVLNLDIFNHLSYSNLFIPDPGGVTFTQFFETFLLPEFKFKVNTVSLQCSWRASV